MSSRNENNHKAFLLLLLFFTFVEFYIAFKSQNMIWDEAVYITIGKYFYSLGKIGLFEEIRPVMLPLVLGFFWKLGFNVIVVGKIIAIIFSALFLIMLYKIAENLFDKKVALGSVMVTILTPIFWKMSTFVLTDIPSGFFALCAFYLLICKKKPFFSGLAAAASFLFRFPNGIFLVVLCAGLLYRFLVSETSMKQRVGRELFWLLFGFFLLVLPYLLFNYVSYQEVTSTLSDALFRPFILASWHQGNPAEAISGSAFSQYFYYICTNISENLLYLFFFIGLLACIIQKKYKQESIIFCFLAIIIPFVYYSSIINKQLRFSILFLPFVALISSYGIWYCFSSVSSLFSFLSLHFFSFLHVKKYSRYFKLLGILFVVSIFFWFYSNHGVVHNESETNFPSEIQQILNASGQLSGPILTSHPAPALFVDASFLGNYYSADSIFEQFVTSPNITLLIYSPATYWCRSNDAVCLYKKQEILNALIEKFNLVYVGEYDDTVLYVFSKNMSLESYQGMPHQGILMAESEKIKLAKNPLGHAFVGVVRVDDAAGIYREDKKNGIWKFDLFFSLMDSLVKNKIISNWAIIPNDIREMNEANRTFLKKYYEENKNSIEITQHGYTHTDSSSYSEFADLSYEEQYEKIDAGKKIINDFFSVQVSSFVPPFNRADDVTGQVLNDLNFNVYSSISSDQINTVNMSRFDQTMSVEKAWAEKVVLYNYEELVDIFKGLNLYTPVFVLVVHPHSFETESDIDAFEHFIWYLQKQDTLFMSLSKLGQWEKFRDRVTISIENKTIFLQMNDLQLDTNDYDLAEELTLLAEEEGNYTLSADFDLKAIYLKNIGLKDNTFCLNEICKQLRSGDVEKYNFMESLKNK